MRLLLVEDDAMLGESLWRALAQNGHTVDWLRDGESAERALLAQRFDLLLLDLGLPRRQGLDVLRRLRERDDATPTIVITARDSLAERVAGLDAGADDYLVKPFALDELEARMRAVGRRAAGGHHPLLQCGELSLDPASHEVRYRGQAVALSAREYQVLHALMRRPGAIISRAAFEERLYGWNEEVDSNAVEVHIHRLRHKLDPRLIRTVRGLGYQMVAE